MKTWEELREVIEGAALGLISALIIGAGLWAVAHGMIFLVETFPL